MVVDAESGLEPALEVVLLANGTEVARSSNAAVWLAAMASLTNTQHTPTARLVLPSEQANQVDSVNTPTSGTTDGLVGILAKELGVTAESLEGSADPSQEPPYIHLDAKYWEAFKRTAGYGRIAPSVLAATLLLLWDRHVKAIGDLTTRECAGVFSAIGLNDKNPTRSIRNCDWLQIRGKTIKLNPSAISKAEKVAAAYCSSRD
jgi:hypothetical protein